MAVDFIVAVLEVSESPDGRSVELRDAIPGLHARRLNGSADVFDNQAFGHVKLNANGFYIGGTIKVRYLVELAILLALEILVVADEMAFDALILREGTLDQQGHFARVL